MDTTCTLFYIYTFYGNRCIHDTYLPCTCSQSTTPHVVESLSVPGSPGGDGVGGGTESSNGNLDHFIIIIIFSWVGSPTRMHRVGRRIYI